MRTTLNLDDRLIAAAMKAGGIAEKTKVIHDAHQAYIERQASLQLARLGGSMPDLQAGRRRRLPP